MSTLAEIEAAAETLPLVEPRELVERLMAKLTPAPLPAPKRSLHDLVDSGIPDLGSNEEHMRGFGLS